MTAESAAPVEDPKAKRRFEDFSGGISPSEAGKRGVEARERNRGLSAEERAKRVIGQHVGGLVKELLAAALGKDSFKELKLEYRLAAIRTALEYGIGKPTASPKGPEEPEKPVTGEDLFA